LTGSGALFILDIINNETIECKALYEWRNDSLYDLCFNRFNFNNILWTVSADGFIQIWDTNNGFSSQPIHAFKAHNKEIYSCKWSTISHDSQSVITVSSDLSIKLWDAFSAQLINQYLGHEAIVYCSQWSPFMSGTFATTSGDSTLRVWSVKDCEPTLTLRASFGKWSFFV
jgi:WD40 repeat protein